jgi:hypothetical protein
MTNQLSRVQAAGSLLREQDTHTNAFASGCDQATVRHKPRLLSDNGPSYVSSDLATWLDNKLKQVDVSEPIIASLVGHKNSSVTLNRYGKAYKVQVLSEAVNRISIDL